MAGDRTNKEQSRQRAWVDLMLTQAQVRDWHGTVSIYIEAGNIRRIEEKRTHLLPPPSDSGNPV